MSAVLAASTWASATTTALGRWSPRAPTETVTTSEAKRLSRMRRSNAIARIQRSKGIVLCGPLEYPTCWARLRLVTPVISGSVPRNRAHAAWEDAVTALLAPPVTFAGSCPAPPWWILDWNRHSAVPNQEP